MHAVRIGTSSMLCAIDRRCMAFAIVVGVLSVDMSSASAGPWVPAVGESYIQAGLSYTQATDRREYLLNLYGEFAVYERLAVIVGIPIKYLDRTSPSPSGDTQGSFFALSPSQRRTSISADARPDRPRTPGGRRGSCRRRELQPHKSVSRWRIVGTFRAWVLPEHGRLSASLRRRCS